MYITFDKRWTYGTIYYDPQCMFKSTQQLTQAKRRRMLKKAMKSRIKVTTLFKFLVKKWVGETSDKYIVVYNECKLFYIVDALKQTYELMTWRQGFWLLIKGHPLRTCFLSCQMIICIYFATLWCKKQFHSEMLVKLK